MKVKPNPRLKICFVSPYIYPLFDPEIKTMFGGFEVRLYQIVTELARRSNFDVCVIVADHGQPHQEFRQGVELISWTNQHFFGIPKPDSQVDEVIKKEKKANPTSPGAINPGSDVKFHNNDEMAVSQSPLQIRGAIARSKQQTKAVYKKVLPWKIRLIIHGFVAGSRDASAYFFRGLRDGFGIWRDAIIYNMRIARTAFSEINNQPLYPEAVAIFEEANADVYAVPGNHWIAARVGSYCKKRRRVYMMMIGSDKDLQPDIKDEPEGFDVYNASHALKLYAIDSADVMTVQSDNQEKLAKYFGISPVLIRNPVDLERIYPKIESNNHILWVGNTQEPVKRPSAMLEVARRLPEFQFTMIVTIVMQDQYEKIVQSAEAIPNLTVMTSVPFQEVEKYFARSRIFVNTSNFEGFPNTFLQAGKYAVPVASLKVDPNHMFTQHGCGPLCEDNLDLLVTNIQRLMCDPSYYEPFSRNILEYVQKYHDKDLIISQYEAVFRSATKNKQRLFKLLI